MLLLAGQKCQCQGNTTGCLCPQLKVGATLSAASPGARGYPQMGEHYLPPHIPSHGWFMSARSSWVQGG